jgi:hypothetical protein
MFTGRQENVRRLTDKISAMEAYSSNPIVSQT